MTSRGPPCAQRRAHGEYVVVDRPRPGPRRRVDPLNRLRDVARMEVHPRNDASGSLRAAPPLPTTYPKVRFHKRLQVVPARQHGAYVR
jgi:hypothetical protein